MLNVVAVSVAMFGIVMAIVLIRRGDLSVFPVLLISSFTIAAIFASAGVFESGFARMWSRMGAATNGAQNVKYFLFSNILILVTYLWARTSTRLAPKVSMFSISRRSVFTILATLNSLYLFLYASNVDWGALLIMEDYAGGNIRHLFVSHGAFASAIISFSSIPKLLSAVILPFALASRDKKMIFIALPAFAFVMLFQLAIQSRSAGLYSGIVTIAFIALGYYKWGIAAGAFTLLNIVFVLVGRGSDTHGVLALADYFSNSFSATSAWSFLAANIFEGVFVQGEVFFYTNTHFSGIYRTLSFSPFPSAIDHFQDVIDHQIRYHTYVPMGATSEVLLFGPPYFVLYWGTVCTAYWVAVKYFRKHRNLLGLILIVWFLGGFYMQFAYPVRNVYRTYLIVIILYSAFEIFPKLRWNGRKLSLWAYKKTEI